MTKPTGGLGVWLWVLAWSSGIVPGCALAFYRTTRQLPRPVDEAKRIHSGNPDDYFPLNVPELAELCEKNATAFDSRRDVWTSQWADRTMIHGSDRPAASFAWSSVRLPDGTVCSGRYSTKVNVSPPQSPGAAGGMVGEPVVTIDEFHLVERLRPPPAEPGWVGLVPGGFMIISPNPGSPRQFLADFPANQDIRIEVASSEGDMDIQVSRDSEPTPLRVTDWRGSVKVHVRTAGTYRVVVAERVPLETPGVIRMVWGKRGSWQASLDLPASSPNPNSAGSTDVRKQPGKSRTRHE